MKILITGFSGFLGNSIAKFFLKKKFEIIGLYNNKRPSNLSKNLKILKIDLRKKIPKIKFDILIHCASRTHVNSIENSRLKSDNEKITKNILKISSNCKKIFFISSLSVYGKIKDNFINEKTRILKPNIYGRSKLENEQLFIEYSKNHNIPLFIFRLPGVVGRNSHSNLISNLFEKIKNKEKRIPIYNKNSNFNNIIHVDEICNFILFILKRKFKNIFYILLLSSKNPVRFLNVVKLIAKINKKKINLIYKKSEKKSFLIKNDYARKIGFKPLSVKKTIEKFCKGNI